MRWSDREIFRRCNVGYPLVAAVRPSLGNSPVTTEAGGESARTYTTKHGTTAEMDTSGVSTSNRERPKDIEPRDRGTD
mgnify:CR=1 FL=1